MATIGTIRSGTRIRMRKMLQGVTLIASFLLSLIMVQILVTE